MTKQKISSLQRQFWLENQHELKPNFFSFRIDTLLSEEKLIEFPSYSAALRGASFVAYYSTQKLSACMSRGCREREVDDT